MSIGERILSEIIKQQMFVIATPDPEVSHVFVWSSGAAEQLEALVNEAYLEQVGAIGPFENPESQKPLEPADTWLQERANWMIAIKLLEAERDALRTLWTEARVVVAQCRDANCLASYGKAQCDAVAAANAWLDKMPATVKRTIDDASNTEWQLQRVTAERDALRAEVEHIKAWANAKADEAQDLRATLLAREGELDELQRQLAEAGKDRERLETVIRWALGEVEDFPTWPDSVTIKGNPKFWWRTELRKRFDTARAGEGRP